jgi:hypothetical protein
MRPIYIVPRDGEIILGGFLVACGDAAKLFELAEAAFNERKWSAL